MANDNAPSSSDSSWRPDPPPVLTKTIKVIWKRNDGGSQHPVNVEEYTHNTPLGTKINIVVNVADGRLPPDWGLRGYDVIRVDMVNFIKTYIENAQPFKNGTFTLPKIGGKTRSKTRSKNKTKRSKTKRRRKSKKQRFQ